METKMKKAIVLITILCLVASMGYSAQKKKNKDNEVTIVSKEDVQKNGRKEKKYDTSKMIKTGKNLTGGGIANFIIGATFLSVGGGILGYTLNNTFGGGNTIFKLREIDWSVKWETDWSFTALLATSLSFIAVGSIIFLLSVLMIPGIILWARGVYLDKKKKVSMSLTGVEKGLALSIKF